MQQSIPFPTVMLLELDTSTLHCKNELPKKRTEDALEFPRNRTDTQPPPATAFRDIPFCLDCSGTIARALFSAIVHPIMLTFDISNAATAPPQVEHGSFDWFPAGHPIAPPTAELSVKLQF